MSRSDSPEELAEPERYELQAGPLYQFDLTRRDLFRLLGAGLVILVLLPDTDPLKAAAQESGGRRFMGRELPQEIGAWLHIAEDGSVTVYTGKVEVGQNIRTSLSQAAAEELRVPTAYIQMVMGDTQLTPFDMGTFGSRTTPTMAPQIRRAAAAARDVVVGLAAKQWQLDPASLTVADGRVLDPASHRSLGYGEILKGQKLMQTIGAGVALTPADRWKVAGTSVPKVDGRAFVTGRHRYTSDFKRDGMLHGKVLRPAAFNAELKSLNTRNAEAMPGVTVVHDGNFVGVAAPTLHDAERALAAIEAEWQAPDQPADRDLVAVLRPHPTAFQGAPSASRLQATYTVPYIAHAPLEPRAAVAEWKDGRLTVWTGTQRPFGVRGELAAAFHLPEDQIRVIVPDTGSGYGGKHTGEAAVEAARLAKAAGKPVKIVWTREEEFTWAYFRPGGVIDVSAVIRPDGTISEWEFHNYNSGGAGIRSPYDIPGQQTEFHEAPSPLRQGSYRALAATANHFARESHMDDLARVAKMDPLAFRLKNLKDERLRAVFQAAAQHFGWEGRKAAPDRGFGIAGGTEKGGYVACCAEVAVDRAGGKVSVIRAVEAFECGAIVNPAHLENQVEGAIVMGLGGALWEAIHFDQGRILNPHFSGYRVPRFTDVPQIEVVLLDRKDLPSAGAGESPIVAIAPAIRNAILDATGIALRSLPLEKLSG
ncbi:MAG TPA: molybdopterin cofactor-binding domain-containing protein [Chthonomonadaceae bacterium]|nr:molybdopterin cofactor-binding domain-containing protein [Chthonomonadaceae bacterium]